MSKGVSYDFGVAIAQGTVRELARTAIEVSALVGGMYALIDATVELDDVIKKNQVAFGGYANTLKALQFSQDKLAKGLTSFDPTDTMEGMRLLARAGIDARQNFELVNKAANATGSSFADMAEIIRSGNFSGLAELGLITDRTAMSMESVGMNASMAARQVKQLIAEANKKGFFEDTIKTMPAIWARLRQFGTDFVTAIIGDPKDPDGLASTVKRYLTSLADWLNKNRDRIIYYGRIVGETFRFVVNVAVNFIKRAFGALSSLFDIQKKTKQQMQDSIMSFRLWLAIIEVKIESFFNKYGTLIKNAIKITLLLFAWHKIGQLIHKAAIFSRALNIAMIRNGGAFGVLQGGAFNFGRAIGFLLKPLASLRTLMLSINAIAMANPITAGIMLAVGALILVIKYFDEIRFGFSKLGDSAALFLGPIFLIIKYWDNFKTMFMNAVSTISNLWNFFVLDMKQKFFGVVNFIKKSKFGAFFISLFNGIKDQFKGVINVFKTLWNGITDFFKNSWLGKVVNWFTDGSKKLTDGSAELLASKQREMGIKVDVKKGVSLAETQKTDLKRLTDKGYTPEQIAAMQNRNSASVLADLKQLNIAPATTNKVVAAPEQYATSSMGEQQLATSSKTVNVQRGAVVINVYNSSAKAEDIAKLVEQKLNSATETDKFRTGQVINYEQ